MIELCWEPLVTAFGLALLAAVAAAPVALVVLIVDGLVGSRIAARFRCWLWIIVALRLIMPVAPGSAASLQNVWTLLDRPSVDQALVERTSANTTSTDWNEKWSDPAALIDVSPTPVAPSPLDWEMILTAMLITVWLAGAVWILLRAIVATFRFHKQLEALPAVDDAAIVNTVRVACEEVGVKTPIIKRVPEIRSPALFGLQRPLLCLPTGECFTEAQLRMIALHEGMHIHRRDGWLAWLLTVVRAVHWCNPLAWLAVQRIEQYREQACDDAVRQHLDEGQHSDYVKLLMRFATGGGQAHNLGLLGLWFARPAQRLTARIVAFTKGGRVGQLPWFFSTAAVVAVAFIGLTDAVGHSSDSLGDEEAMFSRSVSDLSMHVSEQESVEESSELHSREERTYDLTAAVENADCVPPEADRLQWLLTYAKFRPNLSVPPTEVRGDSADRITITMSRKQHEFFANVLEEIERLGHTYQVVVETRIFPAEAIEQVPGIDWREAVRFAAPPANPDWSEECAFAGEPAVSVETVSVEFAPFMVFSLNDEDMQRVDDFLKGSPRPAKPHAKITFFSGQTGTIRDQSQRPFVTSVDYIRGELATAAQPNIVVVEEGTSIDFSPKIYDDDHLDMRCRLTLSSIDRVREVKLPGQDVTVQVPKVTHQRVLTTSRLKRGDSLLIASLGEPTFYYVITPQWFADPIAASE